MGVQRDMPRIAAAPTFNIERIIMSKVNLFANMDALTAIVENVDSTMNCDYEVMTTETAGLALLQESLARISGFVLRDDKEQDKTDRALAVKLLDCDAPMQAIIDNIVRCIQGITAEANNSKSNAAEMGITDAPVGTEADLWRDKLEGILFFVRKLAQQTTRAAFYRYRSAERVLEKAGSVTRDEAGMFTGFYEPADMAVLDDNKYNGWSKIQVNPDTIVEAITELVATFEQIWKMCKSRGVVGKWFQSTQEFNLGGFRVTGSDNENDYVNFVNIQDAWTHFESQQTVSRERASASDISNSFRI